MTEFSPELLEDLAQSHVAKHLDAPYSSAALEDVDNKWVELGAFDLTKLPDAGCTPERENKWEGGLMSTDFKYEHPNLMEMHRTFEAAAKLIVPEEYQEVAKVYFNHSSSKLYPGQHFTFDLPHIDGSFPAITGGTELRMWATATNAVPTGAYLGTVDRDDFFTSRHNSNLLLPEAIEDKNLQLVELPLNTLVLLSPSVIHFAQRAKEAVPMRHFLRWQLHY